MSWPIILLILLALLGTALILRVPVAFAMLAVGMGFAWVLFGGLPALRQVVLSAYASVNSFVLAPIPLFILMGEILFLSGVAKEALATLEGMLGRLPGRLAILSTVAGALFGLLSGSSMANTALLGSTTLPQMEAAGYTRRLGMGSILASGGLAMVIPPSAVAILWAALARVPVGPLLIAGIIPGFLMAVGYLAVIVFWSTRLGGAPPNSSQGPGSRVDARATMVAVTRTVLPLLFVVFMVLGLIYFGIATPTESAATGAMGALVLVAFMGRLNRGVLFDSLVRTVRTTALIFTILVAATLFSQIMSYSGATRGFVEAMSNTEFAPSLTLFLLLFIVIVLGMALDQTAIMLVTLPLFMPIVASNAWAPIWFGILMLIALQIGATSPPFGLNLFIMKAVAPPDASMRDIYRSALPFIGSDIVVLVLLAAIPALVTGLPRAMAS